MEVFVIDSDIPFTAQISLRGERIKLLFGQLHLAYLADMVAGLFLFLILAPNSSPSLAYTWLAALLGSNAVRAVLTNYFDVEKTDRFDIDTSLKFLYSSAAVSGLIWGNSWVLLPDSPSLIEISTVSLWLAGILVSAATTMTVIRPLFLSFAVPACLSFIVYNFFKTTEDTWILIGGFVIYAAFITPIAIRAGKDFNRTLNLQVKNKALQESLLIEASRLRSKEKELAQEKRQTQLLLIQQKNKDEQLEFAAQDRLLLLDAVGDGIFGVSNRGNITFINARALTMLRLKESDLLHQSALRLISATSRESAANIEAYTAIILCFQEGVPVLNMKGYLTGLNGVELPVRFSCTPVLKNKAVVGSVVSFVDVTKQKEMESMLLQSQKMEAVGRLTGGVSHDFNNLLTVIMGNLQFLRKRLGHDEKARALADKVMKAAKNGADLNNRLLSFSREQPLKSDVFYMGDFMTDMHEFIGRLLGENIVLSLELQEHDKVVSIDKTQLQNAILNLGVNAKDAMPNGGTFTISLQSTWLNTSFSKTIQNPSSNEFIEIRFTDTGTGIPSNIQKQIFEPFFTTKDHNQGTGLGLSTVYGFIRQSGGNITLVSEEGAGATFIFYLPVSHETPAAVKDSDTSEEAYAVSGLVLVVEDDNNVREIAVKSLESSGFTVISAANADEGLALTRSHDEIKLVFSDVIMPGGMSGIDMAEKILGDRPMLPILLATGYTEQSSKDRLLDNDNVVIISKPYDIRTLPSLVSSMITTASNRSETTIN
ncbi:MAG: signal transduction histidine kinase/CheY-like chemotaxis protein [Pseudohongiellaceae bacterium]